MRRKELLHSLKAARQKEHNKSVSADHLNGRSIKRLTRGRVLWIAALEPH